MAIFGLYNFKGSLCIHEMCSKMKTKYYTVPGSGQ